MQQDVQASQVFVITPPYSGQCYGYKADATCPTVSKGSMTVNGAGGTAPYTYRCGSSISFTSTNTFTGLKAGSYRIVVNDANACKGSLILVVVENVSSSCLSIIPIAKAADRISFAENNKTIQVTLSPNPGCNTFHLMMHAPKQEPITIRIFHVNGKIVYITKCLWNNSSV